MRHFLITAATISGNKGASGMVDTIYKEILKIYPDSSFSLLSYYPSKDRDFRMKNLSIVSGTPLKLLFITTPLAFVYRIFFNSKNSWVCKLLERESTISAISKSDIVFDAGGITFTDGREIYLPFNIITILPAILMKKKVFKCAQAMGPFKNFLNRVCGKIILPHIEYIFARGDITLKHLESLGLKNVIPSADLTFCIKKEDEPIIHIPFDSSRRKVIISPSSVVYKKCLKIGIDYIQIMAEFAEILIKEKGFFIIWLPHAVREDTKKFKNNDLPIIDMIMETVPSKEYCYQIKQDKDYLELRAIIRQCDFFITSRFHAMVSAIACETPLLVFGWGHKYFEVLEQFGLKDYTIDFKEITLKTILEKFEILTREEINIRNNIHLFYGKVIDLAYKMFTLIKQI